MTFDCHRVRIELCETVIIGRDGGGMSVVQAAPIWHSRNGAVTCSRTPAAASTADSRPELLRNLAAWIEQHDDPALTRLTAAVARTGTASAPARAAGGQGQP